MEKDESGERMNGRTLILVEIRKKSETFLERDLRAFYNGKALILEIGEGMPLVGLMRSWLGRSKKLLPDKKRRLPSRRWLHGFLAKLLIRKHKIGPRDKIIAYWSNHVLSVAYQIRRRAACGLEACAHARDVFVDSHLGKVPSGEIGTVYFCCRRTMEWAVAEFGLDRHSAVFRPHPIPPTPKHRGHGSSEFRILNIARDVPKKNLDGVCRLVNDLARLAPNLCFIQAGAEPERIRERLAAEVRLVTLGAVTEAESMSRMSTSDVLLYGSIIAIDGDRDGIPNVLLEADRIGLPTICEFGWANRDALTETPHLLVDSLDAERERILAWLRDRFPVVMVRD